MHKENNFCSGGIRGHSRVKGEGSREEKMAKRWRRGRGVAFTHGDGCYKLVGLASGSVYRKQMGYACSTPYFTGIYCLLFRRLGMI